MASGKTHEKINIVLLVVLLGFLIAISIVDFRFIFWSSVGYIFGTFYLGPDLDIASRPYNRWGFLKFIWKPYQLLGHRSVLTHGFIVGDIIRFLYLMILLIIISFLLGTVGLFSDYNLPLIIISSIKEKWFIYMFIGCVVSSASHTITDIISSFMNRRRK